LLAGHGRSTNGPNLATSVFVANVADANTGAPVPDAEVTISSVSRTARTNWLGEATIPAVPAGTHRVVVRHLGYAVADLMISFSRDTVGYIFMLTPVPAILDTVKTTGTPPVRLGLEDFERRRRMGIGRFLSDSVLLSEKSSPIAEVMARRFPSLRAIDNDRTVATLQCGALSIYVDGLRVSGSFSGLGGYHDATDLRALAGDDVAGVEYYTAASAPVEFRRLSMGCGVILIWTRR
jgi:carboxypeptidase family protein